MSDVFVSKATPMRHYNDGLADVVAAYDNLANVCESQARIAMAKGDVYDVFHWMRHSIAARAKAHNVNRMKGV